MDFLVDQYGKPLRAFDSSGSDVAGSQTRRPRAFNLTTGQGSKLDKDQSVDIIARALGRSQAERLYQMSWSAKRLVNIVVDDMFAAGRRWTGDDEGANKAMEDAEDELCVWERLPGAIKAGRIFGTGALVVCLQDGQDDAPLDVEKIREGTVANLVATDRWSLSVQNWQVDRRQSRYGEPYQYRWNGRVFGSAQPFETERGERITNPATTSANVLVNRDRIFRFEGHASPLTEGWTSGPWQREWGVSVLTEAIDDILRDIGMRATSGHLAQEASIWVHKMAGFRDVVARGHSPRGEATPEQLAEITTLMRSVFRTYYTDKSDEADRVEVNWTGWPEILDSQTKRLAAIGSIPLTRFLGTSATGLNATGDGEARDWRITVEALRKKTIDPLLKRRLDRIVARHAGIRGDPPEWEWNSLGEMTDLEQADVTHKRTEAVMLAYSGGVIDEDEARERLEQDGYWGELGPWAGPNQMLQHEEEREDEQQAHREEVAEKHREEDRGERERMAKMNGGAAGKPSPFGGKGAAKRSNGASPPFGGGSKGSSRSSGKSSAASGSRRLQ